MFAEPLKKVDVQATANRIYPHDKFNPGYENVTGRIVGDWLGGYTAWAALQSAC
jgi:hypothetical protein